MSVERLPKGKEGVQILFFIYYIMPPPLQTCRIDVYKRQGEHHGLLGGMLESVIKREWPEEFRRIIAITYRFSWGWRRIHNPKTGDQVADKLTTTECAVAMLAARGWTCLLYTS